LLVVATFFYVAISFGILWQNRKSFKLMASQIDASLRPYITCNVVTHHKIFFAIVISNKGRSPAQNLKLNIDKDFFCFGKQIDEANLKNYPAFCKTINNFPMSETLQFHLTQGHNLNEFEDGKCLTPSKFNISAKYEWSGKTYEDVFSIDLQKYMKSFSPNSEAEHLESIEGHLKAISQSLKS